MPAGISPSAQGNDGMPAVGGSSNDVMTTPDLWLPAMTPPSMAHSPGSQDVAPALQDQNPVNAQAAGNPQAASPASAKASSIPMASFGLAAVPAASSAASLAAAESIAGPAAAPAAVASAETAEEFAVPSAASLVDAGLSASLVPPSAAAAGTAGQGMSLDGVAQQPSPPGSKHCSQARSSIIVKRKPQIMMSEHRLRHQP